MHAWVKNGLPIDYEKRLWAVFRHVGRLSQPPSRVKAEVERISRDFIARLYRELGEIEKLPPRTFEELVAELIDDMGYDVRLTPQSRDHSRDILAAIDTPLGPILTLVECKRYQRDNRIGPDIVERFLFTIRERDRANLGVIVSTGLFTSGARRLEDDYCWLLKLSDFEDLQEWIGKYGTWSKARHGGIWLPKITTS